MDRRGFLFLVGLVAICFFGLFVGVLLHLGNFLRLERLALAVVVSFCVVCLNVDISRTKPRFLPFLSTLKKSALFFT